MSKKFVYVNADGLNEESAGAFEEADFISTSAGAGDAGKPVVLDAGGHIDASMINDADLDHGSLGGLADDDHSQYILVDGTRAFTGDQSMGSFKITNLADGTNPADAVNLSQLEAVEAGQDQKESSNYATAAALPSYTAAGSQVGKTLTAAANGILTIDGSATVLGDYIIVKNENGGQGSEGAHVDHGIYEVTTEGTAGAAFVLTRRADFDGNPAGEVTKGARSFVFEGSLNANTGWQVITEDPITVDTTAIQFSQFQGLPSYTASLGVELVGLDFRADLLASGGLKLTGNEIGVEPGDFAGEGLVDDGADNMAIDWSTAFNDAKAIKAEDLNSTANGEGASIVGIEDTGGYFTGTDTEAALQELGAAVADGKDYVEYTVGAGGVTIGDLCYISAANTILPYSTLSASHRGIGLAFTTEAAAGTVKVMANDEVITGVLAGATPGAPYYWDGSNLVTSIPSGGGSHVWQAGIAKNATDLVTEVRFVKKNA